jgi:DNA-binding CsgD family transcriptional regulator
VERVSAAIIDFTESAYDLERDEDAWLLEILAKGMPVLDQGLGVAAVRYGRPPEGGDVRIQGIHIGSGPTDFADRHLAALSEMPPDLLREQARPGQATTMSASQVHHPEALEIYTKHVDYCEDVFGMTAVDARGAGVAIVTPLAKRTTLSRQESERWEMLAAHLDAGHRLRRSLAAQDESDDAGTDLPHHAEAIFDPTKLRISDAVGEATERAARVTLRQAAIAIDKARGSLRESDPEKALEVWQALVRGRWSAVDWFDSDGRRFVLALPNAPRISDPRGLNERERQVVAYAAMGQTNKMIGYRLGLSRSRVSFLLRAAMRKLGVRTRAQLVSKVREFESFE